MIGDSSELQGVLVYCSKAIVSGVVLFMVLFIFLKKLDLNQEEAAKKGRKLKKEIAKRLHRPLTETNSYEDVIAGDVISSSDIDVEFESIGGLEIKKQKLYQLAILHLRRPELFCSGKLVSPLKGMLLYGPPGTGKTMLAKAIAKESGAIFINARMSNILAKPLGEAEKYMAAIFTLAYKFQPAIIFIDQIDGFFKHLSVLKTEFMDLWDGLTTGPNARVMVLGETNCLKKLDEVILRRFSEFLEFGLPEQKERVEILSRILKGAMVENSIDFDYISGLCDGYSGFDLRHLCKKAAKFPIEELLDSEKSGDKSSEPRPLSQKDLEKVLAEGLNLNQETAKPVDPTGKEKLHKIAKLLDPTRKEKPKEIAKPADPTLKKKGDEIVKPVDPTCKEKTNSCEDTIAIDVINPDKIDVEFESIGGLGTKKKNDIYDLVISSLRRPELFSNGKLLTPQKGVLLHGPPGTGKTMLAKAIAKASGATFIPVKMSEKNVNAIFSLAHKLQPAIIFVDEVDNFLTNQPTTDRTTRTRVRTEFMDLWDGLAIDQDARVMVIGATNCPQELDEAILRRFPESFEIGLPKRNERVDILRRLLNGERVEDSINFDYISRLCDGYSGSDLLQLCKKAARFPIGEVLDAEKRGEKCSEPRPLSQKDLEKAHATSTKATVAANKYEDKIASQVINPEDIDVEFESIGGLECKKNEIYDLVILPLRRPELFSSGKLLTPQKGVLLYGPPGTGKTMLAKAIAKESGATFINVMMSSIFGKYHGDSEKSVAAIFSLAYKLQPAIIFIDEVDSLLGKRDSRDHRTTTRVITEFMTLWDGLTTDPNARVMVVGATNRPKELDEAVLRRFSESFEIGLPERKERVDILLRILKSEKVEDSINLDYISGLCDGYSGSDLLQLCKKAARLPIRELLDSEKSGETRSEPRPISQKDLEKVLATSTRTTAAANEYNGLSRNSLTYFI